MNRRPKATPPAPPACWEATATSRASQSGWPAAKRQSAISPLRQTQVPRSTDNTNAPALAHSESDEPTTMPETPQIPTVSRLPDLTEANGSDRVVAAADQDAVRAEPAAGPAPAVLPTLVPALDSAPSLQDGTPNVAAQVPEPATATLPLPIAEKPAAAGSGVVTTAETSSPLPQTSDATPTAAPRCYRPGDDSLVGDSRRRCSTSRSRGSCSQGNRRCGAGLDAESPRKPGPQSNQPLHPLWQRQRRLTTSFPSCRPT